ncbi:MAG: AGE family epimerase/isomerase [Parabacteroides sp.]|nr:AGE family epimerase/isomerase [Parabacteroides sp.]MBP8026694.1 AGE family epimerase/isomerase [Parabacteroides sp.]
MKRFVVGLIGFLFVFSAQANVEADTLRDEVLKDLKENVLHFWEKYAVDPSGGFYGMILNDGTPRPDEAKGVVLNARILWTFSTAYRLFGDENYKHLANRAQRYLIDHFIDKQLGGVYWSLYADGTPLDTEKQTYGMAFAIYGLSEHFRATGSTESLMQSIDLYKVLETQVREFENDGYIESFTRNWQVPPKYGYDGTGLASKTMNTHIHLLEAYTSLYRVWRNEGLQKRLNTLINLVVDKIYNPETNHLKLFFNNQWESLEDIDSYGHDIETGWLLTEAAEVLEDKALLKRIEPIAVNLTDAALKEGRNEDGSLIYERHGADYQRTLSWWCQAETIVGCVNAWQISGNEHYLHAADKTWEWVKARMIDKEHGEWFRSVTPEGMPDLKTPKASMWNCPYHNSRMGFELFLRLSAH